MFSDVIPLNIGLSQRVPAFYFPGEVCGESTPNLDDMETLHTNFTFDCYTDTLLSSQVALDWFARRKLSISH